MTEESSSYGRSRMSCCTLSRRQTGTRASRRAMSSPRQQQQRPSRKQQQHIERQIQTELLVLRPRRQRARRPSSRAAQTCIASGLRMRSSDCCAAWTSPSSAGKLAAETACWQLRMHLNQPGTWILSAFSCRLAYRPGLNRNLLLHKPPSVGTVCRELLGSEELDWHAIAAHFKRSVQAVRSKYRHEQVGCLRSCLPAPTVCIASLASALPRCRRTA